MILKVLGSSSFGNCYIIENDNEALILEAGINFQEVQKALKFNLTKVKALLCTHSHGDHSKYVNEFAKEGFQYIQVKTHTKHVDGALNVILLVMVLYLKLETLKSFLSK